MSQITHDDLVKLMPLIRRVEDYVPYGLNRDREGDEDIAGVPYDEDRYRGDCSCGCRFYAPLAGPTGGDWGVCTNPASHRCGLLTFEHQGCRWFEYDTDLDAALTLRMATQPRLPVAERLRAIKAQREQREQRQSSPTTPISRGGSDEEEAE